MSYDFQEHWNLAYRKTPTQHLGWYEKHPEKSLYLVEKCGLDSGARIFNAGAGTSTLIRALLRKGYSNLIVNDIVATPLTELKQSLDAELHTDIQFVVDDLTAPEVLLDMAAVDLWIDRAVLHFFTEVHQQEAYFDLLKKKVRKGGFVLFAEFSKTGARKCSGLDVLNYDSNMLQERLGDEFQLLETFEDTYIQPSGNPRPFIYALFQRKIDE